jgi:nucleoside-diphosphate-sugar epimerase
METIDKTAQKNVLVTGGTGFVGAQVTRGLLKQGHNVYVLIRNEQKLADLASDGRLTVLNGDLLNQDDLGKLAPRLEQIPGALDAVVHTVGGGPLTANAAFQRRILDLNYTTTANLIRVLESSKLPALFVYLSSLAAMGLQAGDGRSTLTYTEASPCNPVLAYEKAKWTTEQFLREVTSRHAFQTAVLRFPQIYGSADDAFVQMLKLMRSGRFPVVRGESGSLPVIHVADAARAICAVVNYPGRLKGNYDVILVCEGSYAYDQLVTMVRQTYGNGSALKVPYALMYGGTTMLETLFRVLRKPEPLNRARLTSFTKKRVVDCTKFITNFSFNFEQNVNSFIASRPI